MPDEYRTGGGRVSKRPQQVSPSLGTVPPTRYFSMAPSTHGLPCWKPVWPSPSRVTSTPDWSWWASATACLYGVAGSRVVPTTTIGGAPFAAIALVRWPVCTGQESQEESP